MKYFLCLLSLFVFISCQSNEERIFAESLSELHGSSYKVAKKKTLQEGFVVLKNEETGVYTAYDLSSYQTSMKGEALDSFLNSCLLYTSPSPRD